MKLLKTIADGDESICTKYREAARAVLFDKNNKIPILHVTKYNYHKLPGGGIRKEKDRIEALKREVKEETGCKVEVQGEIGRVVEYRTRYKLEQISYCYFGKILKTGEPNFTEEELEKEFEIEWYTLEEALEVLKNDNPTDYEGSLIQRRDIEFLKEAKELFS